MSSGVLHKSKKSQLRLEARFLWVFLFFTWNEEERMYLEERDLCSFVRK